MTPLTFDTLLSADISCIKVIILLLVFPAGKSLATTAESFFIIYQMTDIYFDVSVRTVSYFFDVCAQICWMKLIGTLHLLPLCNLFLIRTSLLCNLMVGFPCKRNIKVHNICPIKFTWKMFPCLHTCLCHQVLMSDRCWVFCRNPSSEFYFEMLLLLVKWSHLKRKLLTYISVTIKDFTLHFMFVSTHEKCDAVSLI